MLLESGVVGSVHAVVTVAAASKPAIIKDCILFGYFSIMENLNSSRWEFTKLVSDRLLNARERCFLCSTALRRCKCMWKLPD